MVPASDQDTEIRQPYRTYGGPVWRDSAWWALPQNWEGLGGSVSLKSFFGRKNLPRGTADGNVFKWCFFFSFFFLIGKL